LLLVALVALHLLLARPAFGPPDWFPSTFATDLVRLHDTAHETGRPWRDFEVEYPPLIYAQTELTMVDDFDASGRRHAFVQLGAHLGIAAALGWGWGRRGSIAYLVLSTPLLAYPFVLLRSDLLAVALAASAAAAWQRRRDSASAALLALAFFAKAWPLVLGGALAMRRRWGPVLIWMVALAAGGIAWVAYGGIDAPQQVLTFRGATGAQIESVAGNIIGITSDVHWRVESGAVRVGQVPALVRVGLPALGLAMAGGAWWLAWRRVQRGAAPLAFTAGATASVASLLATSLLFSTQFTMWLLPWAAIAAAELVPRARWHERAARLDLLAIGLAAAIALAAPPLMWVHPDVAHGDPGLWLLTARNICLVALVVVAVRRLLLIDDDGAERSHAG
jgi:hypothetical protein